MCLPSLFHPSESETARQEEGRENQTGGVVLAMVAEREGPSQVDADADGEPAEGPADLLRRARELALDGLPSLPEVPPPLVVDREGRSRANEAAQLHGLPGGHGVPKRPGHREPHAAE